MAATREIPARYQRFFRALGHRIRSLRMERKLTQEDMISHGFSVRHYQMVEAGRPMNVATMLRLCDAFDITLDQLVNGLSGYFRKR